VGEAPASIHVVATPAEVNLLDLPQDAPVA
jgi:hypothetical protein